MGMTEALYDAAASADLLVTVTVGTTTIACGFEAPDESVLDGLSLSRHYTIEYPTSRLTLGRGDEVTIHNETYRVREVTALRDGSESRATLEKLS